MLTIPRAKRYAFFCEFERFAGVAEFAKVAENLCGFPETRLLAFRAVLFAVIVTFPAVAHHGAAG